MVSEREVREALCEVGRRVWLKGYVASNDGNFSFRLGEDLVLCTPTMISKGFMNPEDMVLVDLKGNQVGGTRRATSESKIHLFIYQQRPDVHSVIHVHPPHATAFTVAQRELPKCILQEIELFLGEIPMAPYATTGTWEFAHTIAPWVHGHDCFLLSNHGAVTVGQDPYDAYYRMEALDQYCRVLLLAKEAGDWNRIDHEGMKDLLRLKQKLGIPDTRNPEQACAAGTPPAPAPVSIQQAFVPHPGPIDDSPKLSGSRPAPPASPAPAAAQTDIRAIVDEVIRRMGKAPG